MSIYLYICSEICDASFGAESSSLIIIPSRSSLVSVGVGEGLGTRAGDSVGSGVGIGVVAAVGAVYCSGDGAEAATVVGFAL